MVHRNCATKAKRRKNGFAFVKMRSKFWLFSSTSLQCRAADKKSAAFVCMCLRNLCLKNQTVRFLRPLALAAGQHLTAVLYVPCASAP